MSVELNNLDYLRSEIKTGNGVFLRIPLNPVSKKNSQRILFNSRKKGGFFKSVYNCRFKYVGVPFIAPSAKYEQYASAAAWYLPAYLNIDFPVSVKCLFYMNTRRRVDLTNLLESIDDILVQNNVLADDNYSIIVSHDGSRVFYDKDNPRTEIIIERYEEID